MRHYGEVFRKNQIIKRSPDSYLTKTLNNHRLLAFPHALRPPLTRDTVRWALRNPRLALSLLLGRSDYESVLQELVSQDLAYLKKRVDPLLSKREDFLNLPEEEIERIVSSISPIKDEHSRRMLNRWHTFLYAATRNSRPVIVVETGVLKGHSSSAILGGMAQNDTGTLISIDLPVEQQQSVIVGEQHIQDSLASSDVSIGGVIPLHLRSRWTLILGNSLQVLPKVLAQQRDISMFIHDSLHTYDHMTAEYNLGYDALEPGGLLVSDDVNYNSAWSDFCKSKNQDSKRISKGSGERAGRFAFLIKPT